MSAALVPTFRQWDDAHRREVCAAYGVSRAELDRLYRPDHYLAQWWDAALKAYEAGAVFSTRHWNSLADWQHRGVLRTHRALTMPGNVSRPWAVAA